MPDIVVTWPKSRPLEDYLRELRRAAQAGQHINFRVPSLPNVKNGDRCYMVHDGYIRGFNTIVTAFHRNDVRDPHTGARMKPGYYIVRNPTWHAIRPIPMKGFRGWRRLPI